jgi:hypothetical protein
VATSAGPNVQMTVRLEEALRYIERGDPYKSDYKRLESSESPERADPPKIVDYTRSEGQPPSKLSAPQSPRPYDVPEQFLDIEQQMAELEKSVKTTREEYAEFLEKGEKTNLFQYALVAVYRIQPLSRTGNGEEFGDDFEESGEPDVHVTRVPSEVYKSGFKQLWMDPMGQEQANIEPQLRVKVDSLSESAKEFELSKATTFAQSRPGRFSEKDPEGKFIDPSTQLIAHSETAAAAVVKNEAARLADTLHYRMLESVHGEHPAAIIVQKVDVVAIQLAQHGLRLRVQARSA